MRVRAKVILYVCEKEVLRLCVNLSASVDVCVWLFCECVYACVTDKEGEKGIGCMGREWWDGKILLVKPKKCSGRSSGGGH